MNYFSKNLKFLREKRNLDAQKVADDLNIPRSTFSCWENGIRTPKTEQIQKVANYINVDIDMISRDYSVQQENTKVSALDELLFSKAKDLSDEDKMVVMNVIDSIKRNIDNENK